MKNRALFNIIFASALWGTSGVGGRYLIDKYEIPAISIGSYRVVLACIFLWLTIIKTKRKLNIETKKDYGLLFIYGLLVATYELTYFYRGKNGTGFHCFNYYFMFSTPFCFIVPGNTKQRRYKSSINFKFIFLHLWSYFVVQYKW